MKIKYSCAFAVVLSTQIIITASFVATADREGSYANLERSETSNINNNYQYDDMRQLQANNNGTVAPTDVTYPTCYVCGAEDLYVGLPNLNITLVGREATCSQLERAGREGLIPSGLGCNVATSGVTKQCQCGPFNGTTIAPTSTNTGTGSMNVTLTETTVTTGVASPVPAPTGVTAIPAAPSLVSGPVTMSSDVPTPAGPTTIVTFAPTTAQPSDSTTDVTLSNTKEPTMGVTKPRGGMPTVRPATPRPTSATPPSSSSNVIIKLSLSSRMMMFLSFVVSSLMSY